MIFQLKFQTICQLSVKMFRSKHDLSVKILSHLSGFGKDVVIKLQTAMQLYEKERGWRERNITDQQNIAKYQCQLSVKNTFTSKFLVKFSNNLSVTLSTRLFRSKHDLLVIFLRHLSGVIKHVEIKTGFAN